MPPANPEPVRRRPPWQAVLPFAVLAALAVLVWATGLYRYLSLEAIAGQRASLQAFVEANRLLSMLAYLGTYVAAAALSIPGAALLTVIGGFLFGAVIGALLTLAAATAGATVIFLLARSAFGRTLRERAGPRLQRLAEGFRADALSYLLFLRLVPIFPFWLVNLAPALLGVRLRTFLLGTVLGIMPGTIAFAVAGAGLDSVIAAQMRANPDCTPGADCMVHFSPAALVTPELLVAIAALGLLALAPAVLRRLRARRGIQ